LSRQLVRIKRERTADIQFSDCDVESQISKPLDILLHVAWETVLNGQVALDPDPIEWNTLL